MAWGRDIAEVDTLYKINGFATLLSLLGSFYMVCCCMRTPSPRSASIKLILALAWSDLFYSIANIMSQLETDGPVTLFCKIEGTLRAVSYIPSLFFTTCIAVLCYKTTGYGKNFKQERFFKLTVSFISIFCLFTAVAPFYFKSFDWKNSNFYCEISHSDNNTSLKAKIVIELILEVIPVLGGIMINLVAYIATIKRLNRLHRSFIGHLDVSLRKLLWYPVVMMVVFLPSVLDNFLVIFTGQNQTFVLTALHLLMTHSIGFSNAIVYGIQRNLHKSFNELETEEDEENYTELPLPSSESICSVRNELLFANASHII